MPLEEDYGPQIHSSNADLCNVSPTSASQDDLVFNKNWTIQTGGKPAGSCTAALFLKAFVEGIDADEGEEAPMKWAHIDIAGTMDVRLVGFEVHDIQWLTFWFHSGYEADAIHGERHDWPSHSVSLNYV